MTIKDKHNILNKPESLPYQIEIGCGATKRKPDWIGIDILDNDCVDIVGDALEILKTLDGSSIKAVYSHHSIEHIEDLGSLMDELARTVEPGGVLDFTVPHFSNPHFYSDYTHKNFFGLFTFDYFAKETLFKRKSPLYGKSAVFDVEKVTLNFKSYRPYYMRHAFKRALTFLFNLNSYVQELYEENFTYIFPCYEIRYILRRRK